MGICRSGSKLQRLNFRLKIKKLETSLESLVYSSRNQHFRHLGEAHSVSYFENNLGDNNEGQPEPLSLKAGLLDAFNFVKDSWSLDRGSAVQMSANALMKRDVAMEDAYADYKV